MTRRFCSCSWLWRVRQPREEEDRVRRAPEEPAAAVAVEAGDLALFRRRCQILRVEHHAPQGKREGEALMHLLQKFKTFSKCTFIVRHLEPTLRC